MSRFSRNNRDHSLPPVSPLDMVEQRNSKGVGFAMPENNNNGPSRQSSDSSLPPSLKSPRTARFAEATSIDSPVDAGSSRSPFADPPAMSDNNQPKISDLGFGYVADNDASRHITAPEEAHTAAMANAPTSPLKSAMKVPGTPGRGLNPLSPTFREEQILEKQEESTDKENAKDLVSSLASISMFKNYSNSGTESQSSSSNGQSATSWSQLQL